jgi:predicted nucleic acid-binding protein
VTVLDAYAVIAYLRDETSAIEVRALLGEGRCKLTAVGIAEVVDHLVRVAGADEEQVFLDLAELDLIDAISIGSRIGREAGSLRSRHYHRTRCPVSMADCLAAAAANGRDDALATADPLLLDLCHSEAIPSIVLPGSDGSRWRPPR